jgi:hypothetical protein
MLGEVKRNREDGSIREVRMRGILRGPVGGLFALALGGCASAGGLWQRAEVYGALTAESAVSQFLDGANRSDYRLMARLFGSGDGPAESDLGRVETEQRMFVLASLLRHASYSLREMEVAMEGGRRRLIADMVGTRNGDVSVPFATASYQGRWFVEQIFTDALTPGE